MSKLTDSLDRQSYEQEQRHIKEQSVGQVYYNPFTKSTTYSSNHVRGLVEKNRSR